MNTYPKSCAVSRIIKSVLLGAALAGAGNALALDVFLRAEKFTKSMPDGVTVTMWGYALDTTAAGNEGALSSPGPVITLPEGDTALNVTLINKLGVPTSLVIPGVMAAMSPVFSLSTGATCTANAADRDCRVRSFTKEAAPGSNTVYSYANVKAGTFLYQSGTSPQVQIQMGLYGAFKHDAPSTSSSPKNAYSSVEYGQDHVLVYSEVDKAFHDAVDSGVFTGSTLNYDPKYFLVNGLGFKASTPPVEVGSVSGKGILLRLLNAGLRTRVPTFSDGHWLVVAEDGNVYKNAKEQYTTFLPAGKTADVWFFPGAQRSNAATSVTYAVFDRRLGLTNNNQDTEGGMLHKFSLSYVAGNPRLSYLASPSVATQDITSTFAPTIVGGQAPFVFALEVAPVGMAIDAAGVLTWKPNNEQARRLSAPAISNPVTVRVTDVNGRFDRRSLSVAVTNVNDAPVATADTFDVYGGVLTVTGKGITRKATDPDGDPISNLVVNKTGLSGTLSVTTSPAASMGAFTYMAANVPATGFVSQSFTYTVSDGTLTSNIGVITLNIHANKAPVANNDRYSYAFSTASATRTLPVVTLNDTDADGTINPLSVTIVDLPNNGGTATVNPSTGRISYKSRIGFKGTDTFTYTVKDNLGTVSNKAFVQVDTR